MYLLAIALPLFLAFAAFAFPHRGRAIGFLAPLASLPALVLAFWPGEGREWSWMLLELELGADAVSQPLLLLVGLAWSVAAWYARARVEHHVGSFWGFWLLCLAGLILALVARDTAGFYLGYATLSLSACGLVIHNRNPEAMRAGRTYLVLAIAGEAMILVGLLQLAAAFGNASLVDLPGLLTDEAIHVSAGWFLLAGFGIKMGLIPLHIWLPLAHPVAPVPASAILSGVIVKAGLLGWLRLAPTDILSPALNPTMLLAIIGLVSLFGGALLALTQQRIKTILAYSTISQMGLVTVAFATSLALDDPMPGFLGLMVLHHGLNKAALFLAAGCAPATSRWRLGLVGLSGLALIGFPFTSGFLAKAAIKAEAYEQATWLVSVITLSSATTALVILHLVRCMLLDKRGDETTVSAHPAWVLMTLLGLVAPWVWFLTATDGTVGMGGVWDSLWPPFLALVVFWGYRRTGWSGIRLPEGDLLVLFERGLRSLASATEKMVPRWKPMKPDDPMDVFRRPLVLTERWLTAMPAVGLVLLALSLALWWSLY